MPSNRNKIDLGRALLDLEFDVKCDIARLTADYRRVGDISVLKQSVDTPHRARAQVAAWIAGYNSKNGAGAGQSLLAEALAAAGSSKTLDDIDTALSALESQAAVLIAHVENDGWTWDQVAAAVESALPAPPADVEFSFRQLPIPPGYTTAWGEPW